MLVNATELREASAPRRAGMHAYQHALTGLASRTHVEQGLAQAAARCQSFGMDAPLLFVDLERSKGLNDTMGHQPAARYCWTRPRGYCRRTTTLPIE